MKKIFAASLLLLAGSSFALAEDKSCYISFINNTDSKFVLFTKHHQFQIHPHGKLGGRTNCSDFLVSKATLASNFRAKGYAAQIAASDNNKSAIVTLTSTSATSSTCVPQGCPDPSQTRIILDSNNSMCVPCPSKK